MAFACLALTTACQSPAPDAPSGPMIGTDAPDDAPSYESVVRRYNQNLASLDQLWARAVYAIRWTDENQTQHFQQGEGHFIFRGQGEVAVRVAKLEEVIFWGGADGSRFWLIDRYAEPSTTYIGTMGTAARGLPFAVQMSDLQTLVGMRPISGVDGSISMFEGNLLVEPADGRARLLLDAETFQPMRIDLLDPDGFSKAVCRMSDAERVPVDGIAVLNQPLIPTRFAIDVPGEAGSMTLYLSDMDPDRVRDPQFDFDFLRQAFPTEQTISLDED